MTKRTWIILGAVALPVVFVAGVWTGNADQNEAMASSTSTTSRTEPTPTTRAPHSTTTTSTNTTTTIHASTTTTSVGVTSTGAGVVPLPPGWASAEVVEVVDGDTIDVRFEDGTVEPLRLIGTNSPEGGECYAAEATAGLTGLVLGDVVHLEPDTSDRDQFGRLLRYVWTADDRFVNGLTVEEGWAIAREYPPDTARSSQLDAAQERAIQAEAGLWAPDACGEALPSDVQITHVEYDAPGNDNFNLNGEWAEITNADDVPVDLTGWVLKDETASHRYSFPLAFTLRPGSTVRVLTGCGENSENELYWCNTGSAIWNNSGDTAFLLDPAGNIVFSYAYG